MSKLLINRKDRNFNVCTDCKYFEQHETIDDKYPDFKRGNCTKLHKIVDNLFECDCIEVNLGIP